MPLEVILVFGLGLPKVAHRLDLRHHPADEHLRSSGVALVDVAHWASEFPWCAQAAAVLAGHFGEALPVRVSYIRTDPWNVEREV